MNKFKAIEDNWFLRLEKMKSCINERCDEAVERSKYNMGYCRVCYLAYKEGFKEGYYAKDDILLQ